MECKHGGLLMAIEIMTWAWNLPIKRNLKYVLLALSDYADENGTCFPSIEKLANKCSTTSVSIIKTIKELSKYGILEKQSRYSNGKKTSNSYCINYCLTKESLPKESLYKESLPKESLPKESLYKESLPKESLGKEKETLGKETLCNTIEPSVKRQYYNSGVQKKRKQKHNNKLYKKYAVEILNFLNEKAGKKYLPTEANMSLISLRLKEFEKFKPISDVVTDCKMIIVRKRREWEGDEKMHTYLRPATLFNKTKFSQYQGELVCKVG
jgi:uncharacterized phage protein (TIGR02220 family)